MRRIYFDNYHPTDLADIMRANCNLKHPRIRFANKELKRLYGAKIKKELGDGWCPHGGNPRFYIEFVDDTDVVAFKLAHGF